MHNAQLRTIIAWAYHLTNAEYQLVAVPTEKLLWDDYDIQALAPGSRNDDDASPVARNQFARATLNPADTIGVPGPYI
jgi:hypothetical protein